MRITTEPGAPKLSSHFITLYADDIRPRCGPLTQENADLAFQSSAPFPVGRAQYVISSKRQYYWQSLPQSNPSTKPIKGINDIRLELSDSTPDVEHALGVFE